MCQGEGGRQQRVGRKSVSRVPTVVPDGEADSGEQIGAVGGSSEIAAIAGTLGVTAKGVSSSMARLSKNAEKPIFGLEKVDAMAWAVTAIPGGLKLNARGVRAIRSSGIRPPGPLGRV